jgi:hypothetical protein
MNLSRHVAGGNVARKGERDVGGREREKEKFY